MDIQAATNVVNSSAELVSAIVNFITVAVAGILSTIGTAATIARFLPPPEQPGLLAKLHNIINKIGQNAGYAANSKQNNEE